MAVLMIDVDHFKYFNDTFGHEAGDSVLQAIGQVLNQSTRSADLACRYGGEEFVLVFSTISLADALLRTEEIHNRIRQLHLRYHEKALGPITVSIGLAMYPEHGQVQEALIHQADMALYMAKNKGRNQTVVAVNN